MSALVLFVFLAPAIAAPLLWLLRPRAARALAIGVAAAMAAAAAGVVGRAAGGEIAVHAFGDWAAPFGIAFVTDRLAALFTLFQCAVLLVTVLALRPRAHGAETVGRALPLLFLLSFGLIGAFQTGDLFNLFVMFELVLVASYLLLQVPGTPRSLAAAFPNVAVNLLASILFFTGVGLLYGAVGTVNLAGLAAGAGDADPALLLIAGSMLAVAFAVKAGLVPLMFWLPATYPAMAGPVAALFAGMMTKLGVYALMRTVPILMAGTPLPKLLVWAGAASALLGVIGALSQVEIRRLLGFHIVSQVGYMVLGLGLMTLTGIAGAVLYLTHHILVKSSLFLVADELERRNGTRDLTRMRPGLAGGGALAACFLIAALSLAGLPPFSGFFAKLGLFYAAIGGAEWLVLAVLVVASFYTLASMLKIWRYAFLPAGPTTEATAEAAPPEAAAGPRMRAVPVALAAIVLLSVALALGAGPAHRYSVATAAQLLDPSGYVEAVAAHPARLGVVAESR